MTDEAAVKHHRLAAWLDGCGLDSVILSRRCNFSWYTCGAHNHVASACDIGSSSLLVGRNGATVLANNIEAERLRAEELAGADIGIVEFPYFDAAARAAAFSRAIGSARVAADAPVSGIDAPLPGADFDRLRWVLTESEVRRYRDLCTDVAEALEAVARSAQPGWSENRLAGMVSAELHRRNCLPWVLLVGGDERVEHFRHPLPTDNVVQRYFMLVACAERGGLIAACTRLASFGPISAELADKHRAVATVDVALISSTRPGTTLGDIFAEGQAAYAEVGFPDEWRLHHQGGSCGYLPREIIATPDETTTALAEQAFAWNPSITGTKSEDTILCREDGPELLADPSDWPTIAAEWKGATMNRPDILIL